jgi:hypothetical protein
MVINRQNKKIKNKKKIYLNNLNINCEEELKDLKRTKKRNIRNKVLTV